MKNHWKLDIKTVTKKFLVKKNIYHALLKVLEKQLRWRSISLETGSPMVLLRNISYQILPERQCNLLSDNQYLQNTSI